MKIYPMDENHGQSQVFYTEKRKGDGQKVTSEVTRLVGFVVIPPAVCTGWVRGRASLSIFQL